MDPLISILRNWSLLAGGHVVSSLMALVLMVTLSRTLGDVEFGRLYLALTLSSIIGIVVDLGLSPVVARAVARDRSLARPYFWRAAALLACAGTGMYLVLVGLVGLLGFTDAVRSLVIVLGVLMLADGLFMLLGAVFQGHERMSIPMLARVAANAFTLMLVIPLLLRGYGTLMVALVIVLAAGLRVAILAVASRRLAGFQLPAPPAPSWSALVGAGWPFLVSQCLGLFVFRIDVVILARMATEAAVGWYAAASRLMEAFNFIPVVLATATYPVLSRLWVDARDEFEGTVRKTLDLLLVLTVPVAVTLFALAEDIVGFFFTLDEYGSAVPILRIQAISLALVFVDYLLVSMLMAIGRERVWIAIVGAACFVNPALNWLLIPATEARYENGAIGAALATLLTELFILTCALRAVPSGTVGADAMRVAARASALGAVLGVALVGSRIAGVPWIPAAAVGGIVYLAIAIRLGVMPPDVTRWARGLVFRRRPPMTQQRAADAGSRAQSESPQSVDAA
jgi:O-antigen/teichoic acid export membrane protein